MEGRERQLLVLDKVTGDGGSGAGGGEEGKVVEGEGGQCPSPHSELWNHKAPSVSLY